MFTSKVEWSYCPDGTPKLRFYDGEGRLIREKHYDTTRGARAAETKFHNAMREEHKQQRHLRQHQTKELVAAMTPELSFEISEADITIDELIREVHRQYGYHWEFDRTEARYDSCVMAIFQLRR